MQLSKYFLIAIIAVFSTVPTLSSELTVKDKMIFEGIVNDYMLRMKAKDSSSFIFDFDYWTDALTLDEIIVYIYVRPPISQSHNKYAVVEKEIKHQFEELRQEIVSGILQTILAWPEFREYRDYKMEVVLRIEEKIKQALLESYLNKLMSSK